MIIINLETCIKLSFQIDREIVRQSRGLKKIKEKMNPSKVVNKNIWISEMNFDLCKQHILDAIKNNENIFWNIFAWEMFNSKIKSVCKISKEIETYLFLRDNVNNNLMN
jgi:hypothetical protein